jgi:general bacterial porin, GBP family
MYRKIIAVLAVSMLMSEAQAQSSVTLSGIIDGGLSFTNGVGAPDKNQWAYGQANLVVSRLIFSGVEDLGGGNQALFKLESGFLSGTGKSTNSGEPTTAGSFLFDRGAWVGLKNDEYGTLSFGRHYTPFVEVLYRTDASGFENFGSVANTVFQTRTGFSGFQYTWANNGVKYQTPTFHGLSASVMNSFGGTAGDFQNGREVSAALYYTLGPVSLNAGYIDGNDPTGLTDATVARAYTVFLAYTGDRFKASLNLQNFKDPATGSNQFYYSAGGRFDITPSFRLVSDYTYLSDRKNNERNGDFFKLGVHYLLSKSTDVYAEGGLSRNNSQGTLGISSTSPAAAGVNQRSIVTGVIHFF